MLSLCAAAVAGLHEVHKYFWVLFFFFRKQSHHHIWTGLQCAIRTSIDYREDVCTNPQHIQNSDRVVCLIKRRTWNDLFFLQCRKILDHSSILLSHGQLLSFGAPAYTRDSR